MDVDVKAASDIDNTIKDYDILARYDITKEDIETLRWRLTYPPSSEMSAIHMYINSQRHTSHTVTHNIIMDIFEIVAGKG